MTDHHYSQFYVGGQWVSPAHQGETISVVNPSTEQVYAQVPEGSADDVNSAVRAHACARNTGLPLLAAKPQRSVLSESYTQNARAREHTHTHTHTATQAHTHSRNHAELEFVLC